MNRPLGALEFSVLAALRSGETYGEEIRRMIDASFSVSTTLVRMEAKGLVASSISEPVSVRGGRSRRIYQITRAGRVALRQTEAFYSRSSV